LFAERTTQARYALFANAGPVVVRAAEPEAPAVDDVVELMEDDSRGNRRLGADKPEFKHFLPLPLPSHLVYVKPTVAVVAGMASRSSVGLKMTAGDNQLERYVIEFYSKVGAHLQRKDLMGCAQCMQQF
jgi:hypothetical protein